MAECVSAEVAAALTRCFEGYLTGPVSIDAGSYERRFRAEDLDPFASRVYLRHDEPAGILLVARRGWTSRVAAMGVAPERRGKGLGRRMLRAATGDAASRGDQAMVLEVFEQNTPALRLYETLGFRVRRRLYGYRREPGEAPTGVDPLSELDPLEVARVVAREGEEDPPWMLAAETVAAATLPARAYHLDHRAYALVANPDAERLILGSIVVPRSYRRQGWGTRLLRGLEDKFPGRNWAIPQILPEGPAGEFFRSLGWEREPLNQLEMRLDLPPEKHEANG